MIKKTTIPAGHGKAFILLKSQTISVVNTYGTQVVDCWAFNRANTNEYMSMEASRVSVSYTHLTLPTIVRV